MFTNLASLKYMSGNCFIYYPLMTARMVICVPRHDMKNSEGDIRK